MEQDPRDRDLQREEVKADARPETVDRDRAREKVRDADRAKVEVLDADRAEVREDKNNYRYGR